MNELLDAIQSVTSSAIGIRSIAFIADWDGTTTESPAIAIEVGKDYFQIDFEAEPTASEVSEIEKLASSFSFTPPPNWKAFVDGLGTVDGFYAAVNGLPVGAVIIGRMVRLTMDEPYISGGNDPLISIWNSDPPELSKAQRDAANQLASSHDIPLLISESNALETA